MEVLSLTDKELFSNTGQARRKIWKYLHKKVDLIIEDRQFVAIAISVTVSTIASFYVNTGKFPINAGYFGIPLIDSLISVGLLSAFLLLSIILVIFVYQTVIDFCRYLKNKIVGGF